MLEEMTDTEPSSVERFKTRQKNLRIQPVTVIYTIHCKLAETVESELTSSWVFAPRLYVLTLRRKKKKEREKGLDGGQQSKSRHFAA